MTRSAGLRVAVFPIAAIGHVNPLLSIVAALTRRADVAEVRCFGPAAVADVFRSAGASHTPVDAPQVQAPPGVSALAARSFLAPLLVLPECLAEVARFRPDVVLYDVFCVLGAASARHVGVPAVSVVTMPGYGSVGEEFIDLHGTPHPQLDEANGRYRDLAGADLLDNGGLPVLFPSDDLAVVTATEELATRADARRAPRLAAVLARYEKTCEFVGPCVSSIRMTPPAPTAPPAPFATPAPHDRRDPAFPFPVLTAAKRDGRTVVLFSIGTVLTDFRFDSPVGGAPTGRDFLRRMLRHLVDAFADSPDVLVVASLGTRLPAADEPAWPANFVVRDFLPQVEILDSHAKVFITHHGMNSTTESVLAGVPMVSLPGVGDQVPNARAAIVSGAAEALWDLTNPYGTCDADLLGLAVRRVVAVPSYRESCARLRGTMTAAGGPSRAADLVVALSAGPMPLRS